MKKICILLVVFSLMLVSCNNKDNTENSQIDKNVQEESNEVVSKTAEEENYLESGQVFVAENDKGTYEFKVLEANYLGVHDGDVNKNERVQVVWEVSNIDFKGSIQNLDGSLIENVVSIDSSAIKVKDDNQYILNTMTSGWDGDWSNEWIAIKPGEKAIQKFTWILNDKDTEYIYASYPRMENQEYKIKVNR